jgi:hypothetical protein
MHALLHTSSPNAYTRAYARHHRPKYMHALHTISSPNAYARAYLFGACTCVRCMLSPSPSTCFGWCMHILTQRIRTHSCTPSSPNPKYMHSAQYHHPTHTHAPNTYARAYAFGDDIVLSARMYMHVTHMHARMHATIAKRTSECVHHPTHTHALMHAIIAGPHR